MSKKANSEQTGQFGLFDTSHSSAPVEQPLTRDTTAVVKFNLNELGADLLHPYPRYGLAVASYKSTLAEIVAETELRIALVRAIESGISKLRMRTWDNPSTDKVLKFVEISQAELAQQPNLNKGKLAERGVYLFPSVVTIDGMDTPSLLLKAANEMLVSLNGSTPLLSEMALMRAFAPTTAKINNGIASQSPPKGSLLEAVCALITTITHLKPAALVKPKGTDEKDKTKLNTVIIPDLPLKSLKEFVAVFDGLLNQESENLMCTSERLPIPVTAADEETKPKKASKAAKPAAPEFRRPRLHSGNYPDAPRDAGAFGPVGLLGAIGRWARRTKQQGRGRAVLDTLAGRPLHVISYDQISQVRFDHHITRLALDYDLTSIVDSLYLGTRFYSESGNPGTPFGKPEFKIFCLMASRFLQSFTTAAFIDFLAFRAEYAAETEPLFTEYFRTMKPEIVESAAELGLWLNRTAFFVAKEDVEKFPSKDKLKSIPQQERERKAKILVVLESAILSAKSPEEMISQVLTQAERMSLDEAPNEARRYVYAATTREITHDQAKHLLIAYMRLRSVGKNKATTDETEEASSAAFESQATENYDHSADN